MKYAKKMKLVEVDDISSTNEDTHQHRHKVSDENYSKPYVLSSLDQLMSDILSKKGISDVEKWQLYSQSLQKYLNFVKTLSEKSQTSINHSEVNQKVRPKDSSILFTPSEISDFNLSNPVDDSLNLSVLTPIRDSIDSISAPRVRHFFERAREMEATNNKSSTSIKEIGEIAESVPIHEPMEINYPVGRKIKKASNKNNRRSSLMYQPWSPIQTRSLVKKKKRKAETALLTRPCKVILNDLYWEPTSAR